jgi:hypothetical protein
VNCVNCGAPLFLGDSLCGYCLSATSDVGPSRVLKTTRRLSATEVEAIRKHWEEKYSKYTAPEFIDVTSLMDNQTMYVHA